jgi:hypothetical protein
VTRPARDESDGLVALSPAPDRSTTEAEATGNDTPDVSVFSSRAIARSVSSVGYGVWETTAGVTDDEARLDWPVLRDAPNWQYTVTGPSGHVWRWRAFSSFPHGTVRDIAVENPS